jgi:hypothetical protein
MSNRLICLGKVLRSPAPQSGPTSRRPALFRLLGRLAGRLEILTNDG